MAILWARYFKLNISSKFIKRSIWVGGVFQCFCIVSKVTIHTQKSKSWVRIGSQRFNILQCVIALFLPSEQYFHYLDEKCMYSSKMQRCTSYAKGVEATLKVLSPRQTVTPGHRKRLYIWVWLPFFSAALLLARLMTYFPTPGDNILLCKMPLNIPPSISLPACEKVFRLWFPPPKVALSVWNMICKRRCDGASLQRLRVAERLMRCCLLALFLS